jgi:transposase
MTDMLTILTERVDDIPLLLAQMRRMNLPQLLDAHFLVHGNRQGLSFGWTTVIWLTHLLSHADHRMNRVQPWAERRLDTLRGCTGRPVQGLDLTDDRLADILRLLSEDAHWLSFERDLTGNLLRVYDLRPTRVRLDSTTVSGYGAVSADGLLQFGHSKDRRPDLPQLKVVLATLDPLGVPIVTEVVSGERADDPLYLPAIARVRSSLLQRGLLYIGDCKMSALATRAGIQAGHDFYLCPLAATQVDAATLEQELRGAWASGPAVPITRHLPDGCEAVIADGYERTVMLTTVVSETIITWVERRLLVQSHAQAHAAETALRLRLRQAQTALADLTVRRRGKARLSERVAVEQAVADILTQYRIGDLLAVSITEHVQEQVRRAYRTRPRQVRVNRTYTITTTVDTDAVDAAMKRLGWRVYATNQPADQLTLGQAVLAYRDEYLVERDFGRLKGQPLSLAPQYVARDDHATGLVRLLTIALRVLTLLEFVVRRSLARNGQALVGLYAGNPKRTTAHPTTERILEAFQEITLTVIAEPHQTRRHVTALSALQQQLLTLLEFTPNIYTTLCGDSAEPP